MANSSFYKNTGTSTQLQTTAASSAAAAAASEAAALASENAAQTSETNSAASAAASATSAAQSLASANSSAASESNAATSEANALASSTNAQDWAVKTDGIVDSTDYASKAWAIGGTGVTGGDGASKEWSTLLGSTVDGSDYSAKHYSQVAASEAADAAADAVATAADRVQTGLDVVAAAGSATAASNSQIAAASSAAAAAATLDTFDDRYLGSYASDPTVDNDGNALVTGALYFSSTANEMRVYDGGNWIAASSAGGASLLNYNFTATAAQTTFSGSDDNSRTLSYTVDNLIVTRNGVVLEDGTDYTATSGTSIVLASAASAGDEINIVAFKSFTTADMVSATNGGAFQGNVDFAAGIDVTGNVTVTGTVDGRDVATDGTKLDGIEAGADVTDATNVAAAGAAMLTGANFTGNVDVTGTGTMDRLGLGSAAHASAALLLTTTNQHIRMDNGGELGVIELDSDGKLNIWAHGDGETINLKTGSGSGTDVLSVVGSNVGIGGAPSYPLHVQGNRLYLTNAGNTELMTTNLNGNVTGGIQALSNQSLRLGTITNWNCEMVVNNAVKGTWSANGLNVTGSVSAVNNHAAHTNIDVFNNSGSASARGQLRVGYDASACLEIFRVGNAADITFNATQGGPLIFQQAGSEKMRIDSGTVSIGGNHSTTNKFRVTGDNPTGYTTAQFEILSNVGNVIQSFHAGGQTAVLWKHPRGSQVLEARNNPDTGYININANAFAVQSDYRLKENIVPISNATERLKKLNPVRFNFKPFEETGVEHHGNTVDGFLANEVSHDTDGNPIVPEAVTGEKDAMRDEQYVVTPTVEATYDDDGNILTEAVPEVIGTRSVPDYQFLDQSKLVPLLVKTIQELEARIAALENA